jgi:hypothetical protein
MQLTEAQYNVADIVLLKMPSQTPINIPAYMQSVLVGCQDKFSPEIFSQMQGVAISRDSTIRTFLLHQEYTTTIDHTIQRDMLTKKGELAKELGGHKEYLHWEEQEKIKDRKGQFPKRNVILYDSIKILISLFAGIFIGRYACNQPPKSNSVQYTTQSPSKDTSIRISPPAPETSNKKDSL